MTWQTIIINVFISIFSGGVGGTLVKYFVDRKFAKEAEILNKKRSVYEEMAKSLNIFVAGRQVTPQLKEKFYDSYSTIWLWAPDEVVNTVGEFLKGQMAKVSQEEAHKNYVKCIIAMRKDIGYEDTKVEFKDYQFVNLE